MLKWCPKDLRKGPMLCNLILDDLEKAVNNELITFVDDKVTEGSPAYS